MKRVSVFLLFSLAACNQGPFCPLTASDIQNQSPQKLLVTRGPGNKITGLADAGWDSAQGGVYAFYPDEKLKSYTFYQNNQKAVYREEYNARGAMKRSEGSPMVDRIITEVNLDSAFVQIYFFKLQKTFQPLQIRINENPAVSYSLTDDSLYSNIKTLSFGINTAGMSNLNIYSRLEYMNECSKIDHVLTDTLRLVKNPHISPAGQGN